ncbi:MAG: threonine-phosphate decarboxylase, partial [Prochlorothrix sp.]
MSAARPLHGGNLAWAAAQADCAMGEILDFSASINPLGPPLSAIHSLQAALHQIHAYPDNIQREDLDVIEEAKGYDRLMKEFSY